MKLTLTKKKEKNIRTAIEKDRTKFIGGSEVGTILNLNPFKSAYTLWAEKTGRIETEDISDKEAVWWGTHTESIVAERFAMKSQELTGKKLKVQKCNYTFSCKEYPYMQAHIDRRIVGDDVTAGLEIKTTSAFSTTDYAHGEIPPAHYAQCVFYLAMTGWKRWYVCTKQDNSKLWVSVIERNEEEIEALLNAVKTFWKQVQEDEHAEIDASASTSETLALLYPRAEEGKTIELPMSAEIVLESLDEHQAVGRDLEWEIRQCKNEIRSMMEDAETGILPRWTVTYRGTPRRLLIKKRRETENG